MHRVGVRRLLAPSKLEHSLVVVPLSEHQHLSLVLRRRQLGRFLAELKPTSAGGGAEDGPVPQLVGVGVAVARGVPSTEHEASLVHVSMEI